MFQNKQEIQNLLNLADDKNLTKEIISKINQLKEDRPQFYLTIEDLELILKWKLRSQYGRQKVLREKNTDMNVLLITKTAFAICHTNEEIEIALKLRTLTLIYGVGIPVASSILTLCYPNKYSVIDFRNWRQIFRQSEKKSSYTTNEYKSI